MMDGITGSRPESCFSTALHACRQDTGDGNVHMSGVEVHGAG